MDLELRVFCQSITSSYKQVLRYWRVGKQLTPYVNHISNARLGAFAFFHHILNLSNDRLRLDHTRCALHDVSFTSNWFRMPNSKNRKIHQVTIPTAHVMLLIHCVFLKKYLLSSGWPDNISYSSMCVLLIKILFGELVILGVFFPLYAASVSRCSWMCNLSIFFLFLTDTLMRNSKLFSQSINKYINKWLNYKYLHWKMLPQ